MDTAHARAEAALRRDAALEAVAFAAQRLLLDPDWEALVPSVLRRLGEATGVSRVYLFENHADGSGMTLRHRWAASEDCLGIEAGSELGFDGLGRWATLLGRGDLVQGIVAELPPLERDAIDGHGIRSIVLAPVAVAGGWWGSMGFDDCEDERVWTQIEIDALRAASGTLGAAIERERGDRRLRDAEARYRRLVEEVPTVTYIDAEDPETGEWPTRYVSPQISRVLGYSQDEWLEDPLRWRSALHPDDRERAMAEDRRHYETGEPLHSEYRLIAKDGSEVWIRDHATILVDEKGVRWSHGVLIDVTESKRVEERMRSAEARFRDLVENIPAVTYRESLGEESDLLYVSPQVENEFGYRPETWMTTPDFWFDRIHPDDLERVTKLDRRTNATGEPFSAEYRFRRADGTYAWIHDQATLVGGENGPRFWQGFMLDVTDRKRVEERLEQALEVEREATQRLRSLDEMKNTFLQAVSHDLRTPLAAILGLAVTLERAEIDLPPDDTRDMARRIAANARKLDRMVTDLLDLDRLARGIVAPKLRPTDVAVLVDRVARESTLWAERRVSMEGSRVVANVDPAKVERIVENLLANTLRHTPSGTPVAIRVGPFDHGVLIVVEDEGPGVPPDLRETIFEPFRQGPEAPEHSPGVGVGLTLVRRFAELHGGRAWVEERAGGGASFRVYLPGASG